MAGGHAEYHLDRVKHDSSPLAAVLNTRPNYQAMEIVRRLYPGSTDYVRHRYRRVVGNQVVGGK